MTTAKITDENGTTVCFEGTASLADYGVSGSPTWGEIDDVKIISIELEDGTIFEGAYITAELRDQYIGLADDLDWDADDGSDNGYYDYRDSKYDRD